MDTAHSAGETVTDRRRAAELEVILAGLAEIRDRVRGRADAVAVVREGRQELAERGLCAGER